MVSHHFYLDDVQSKQKQHRNNPRGLKVVLDELNSYLLHKLVELRPFKNFGSNEPLDLGYLWQRVFYWYQMIADDMSSF